MSNEINKIEETNPLKGNNKPLKLSEVFVRYKLKPKRNFIWGGIMEKSFGIFFGPSKSGKTVFCENLAMNLATGRSEYFGNRLKGLPIVVLFVGLEEFWENRAARNKQQYETFSEAERKLLDENYHYQSYDFKRHLTTIEHFKDLEELIRNSGAEVIFIDSLTRLNHGTMEDSKTAEVIMERLHEIQINTSTTIICVHHTPKMNDSSITMDKIKGSSVFAQESDFAYGINRTSLGVRYVKTVFLRYADDSEEKVKEFQFEPSTRLKFIGEDYEEEILNRSDRRRDDEKRELIIKTVDSYYCKTISTKDLVKLLKPILGIQERQIKGLISELVKEKKINSPKRGYYESINCTNKEGGSDEKE